MNPDRPGTPGSDAGRAALPWVRIGLYVLASRVFIYVLGYLSIYIVAPGPTRAHNTPLDLFFHWDAHWYETIARDGYTMTKDGLYTTAFFPLYPLLMHVLAFVVRDLRVAGYLISNACLYGSCLLLWRLVMRDDQREDVADRAVTFFLFCPVSFFYSCIYSDSLFFLLMLATVCLATERRWFAAGACGFLASLTRPVGILLVVALMAEFLLPYLRKPRGTADAPAWPAPEAANFLVSLAMTGAGLGFYSLYLANHVGDPLAFLHAQAHWHREFALPWETLRHIEYGAFYEVWFRAAVVMATVVLVIGLFVKLRESYLALCLVYMTLYLSTLHLESVPRFLSVLFPFYIIIARVAVRFPRLEPLLLAGSSLLLALSTVLFVNGYWFT